MANLVNDTLGGWEVDDVDMLGPGWAALNLHVLWQGPSVVFSNRQQAGGVGRKGYPGLEDETRLSMRFAIVGDIDPDGEPVTDPQEGIFLNYMFLRENVFDPTDPLRVSTLTGPDGSVWVAEIQFDPFPLPEFTGLSTVVGTLGIILPGGAHYPEGS